MGSRRRVRSVMPEGKRARSVPRTALSTVGTGRLILRSSVMMGIDGIGMGAPRSANGNAIAVSSVERASSNAAMKRNARAWARSVDLREGSLGAPAKEILLFAARAPAVPLDPPRHPHPVAPPPSPLVLPHEPSLPLVPLLPLLLPLPLPPPLAPSLTVLPRRQGATMKTQGSPMDAPSIAEHWSAPLPLPPSPSAQRAAKGEYLSVGMEGWIPGSNASNLASPAQKERHASPQRACA